jgi:ribosomal protein S12 methylthiotransferase
MLAGIGQAGFVLSSDPDSADVVVINTCGFIKPAKDEAIAAIRQAVSQKKKGRVRKVIVAGCLSQRMGKKLLNEVKGIDAIAGLDERDEIAKIIEKTLTKSQPCRVYRKQPGKTVHDDRGRLLITPGHWAYLRISEGCDRKCSFCTIPAIRGPFRSKPEELILSEAHELVENGAVELSIIAQDSNFYGKDLRIQHGLSKLIKKLEQIDRLEWIRLMYLYPASITNRLIETIAASAKVLNYIDMPIQHINNEILRDMRRIDRKEKTVELIEKLRSVMPDVVLRTTVIVGFPGETDAKFAELLDFIRWAEFDALGCFTFYPELETAAVKLPGQIPQAVKKERAEKLMLTQQQIAFARGKNRIGRQLTCLVDEIAEAGIGYGRFYGQAPHIDGICIIRDCPGQTGRFLKTKVIDIKDYDLVTQAIF